ncbi:MAG: hypothetical protein HFI34_05940 [Lachnospiraceae bacterium]|nr:hypothetical protein [Lachnospiraceae bacterium]
MQTIERLGNIQNPNFDELGRKIYWLDFLKKKGYDVSEGYAIPKSFFNRFISENNIDINSYKNKPVFKYDEIRQTIYKNDFPEEMKNILYGVFSTLKSPLIVRSSSSYEDMEDYSCAGMFTSVNGVNNFDEFLNAIKICWISSFDESIDYYIKNTRDFAISLLIQEELNYEFGGVAFSVNPISGNANEILIESSKSGPKAVVTGSGEINNILISKYEEEEQEPVFLQIKETLLALESYFGTFVDMEWLFDGKTLSVLQARPVTTIKENQQSYIDVDDDVAMTYQLKNLSRLHSRWIEKKKKVRKCCKQNNIKVGGFYYWFRDNDPEANSIDEILNLMPNANSFEVHDGKDVLLVQKEDVKETVKQYAASALRIAESVPTEYCGFASVIDDKYYIEAAKGGFTAFYSGEFEVTKYVVDSDGKKEFSDEKYFDEEYFYDGKWWAKRSIEPTLVRLSDNIIKDVIRITLIINKSFNNARVEWILNEKGVYLFDITVENDRLLSQYGEGKIISAGKCCGNSKVLKEITVFDDYINKVSIRMGYQLLQIEADDRIKKIKDSLSIEEGDIVVCEYPNEKLAVILDKAKGFIFERGSLLCHFAIILRERHIPAVVYPKALERIKDGQMVSISDGEVKIEK